MQETWETQVRFLNRADPLEEEVVTHSGILPWKIPWREQPGGLQSKGGKESDATEPRPFSENAILQVDSNNEI